MRFLGVLVLLGALTRADEPDTAALVRLLVSDDASERFRAAARLREVAPGRPKILTAVLPLLDHESERVRADAIRLLGRLGGVRATGISGHAERRKKARRLVTEESEAAVARGLAWLASVQAEDGRWDSDAHGGGPQFDVGITGYVVLAFFGAGSTDREGEHAATVRRALDYLLSTQGETGRFGGLEHARFGVRHSIVTSVVCEAWIRTWDPKYRAAARRAVRYLEANRLPDTGWGYRDHMRADAFETTWALHALRFAEFGGIEVRAADVRAGFKWLAFVTEPHHGSASYDGSGYVASYAWERGFGGHMFPVSGERFGVFVDRDKHSAIGMSMTAAVAWCVFLSVPGNPPFGLLKKQAASVATYPPEWDEKLEKVDYSAWPPCALVMVQGYGLRRSTAIKWFRQLHAVLLPQQDENGSWPPVGPWGPSGGRLYSTASAILALEAPYRYSHRLVHKAEFDGPYKAVRDALKRLSRSGDKAQRAVATEALAHVNRDGTRYLVGEIYR